MKKLFFLCLLFFLASCTKYPEDVQRALLLSGDNRLELEKVLEYFREKGKVAFESACFLIGNMPYHESRCTTPVDPVYFQFFQQTDSIYQSIFSDMKLHEIQTYKNKNLDFMRRNRNEMFKEIVSHEFDQGYSAWLLSVCQSGESFPDNDDLFMKEASDDKNYLDYLNIFNEDSNRNNYNSEIIDDLLPDLFNYLKDKIQLP